MKPVVGARRRHQSGITLIAMATLLIVASLAVAALVVSREQASVWEPRVGAKEQLEQIDDALVRYQRANHRLPCPAPTNVLPDDATYGTEVANCSAGADIAGVFRTISGGMTVRIGSVPVRTLGLPVNLAIDPWGARIQYAVTEQRTDPYQFSGTAQGLRVNNAAGTALTTSAGYVLVSHGKMNKGAYQGKSTVQIGSVCPGASEGLDSQNCYVYDPNGPGGAVGSGSPIFVKADFNNAKDSNFFDDYVLYNDVDAMAKTVNNPCANPSPANPYSWLANCSGTYTNLLHGASQTINNTASGYTGTTNVTCDNGSFSINSESCTAVSAGCTGGGAISWNGAATGCTGTRPASLAHGGTSAVANTNTGRSGSITVNCTNGVYGQTGGTCTGSTCTLPWGGSIAHGASVTAYSGCSASGCASETRTCSFGVLSGSYTNQTCTGCPAAASCNLPWGGSIASGASVTAYTNCSVTTCSSQTRTCTNGTLSGTYPNAGCGCTCTAGTANWNGTANGCSASYAAITYGGSANVTNSAGGRSGSAKVNCSMSGVISYSNQVCISAGDCTWNPAGPSGSPASVSVANGNSVTAYLSGTGSPCQSQSRTCNSGTLSGTYTYYSCTPTPTHFAYPGYGCLWHPVSHYPDEANTAYDGVLWVNQSLSPYQQEYDCWYACTYPDHLNVAGYGNAAGLTADRTICYTYEDPNH